MLRIFHTADWHLGQSLHGFERDYEHACFLDWLLQKLEERQPDVLLVAGDVFDSINPPATAQRRYYDFLSKAHRASPNLQMVLTAGNHDAASRLEAPSELFGALNIVVIGTVSRGVSGEIDFSKFLVPLKNASGEVGVICLAVPFLRPSDVPFVEDTKDQYQDGIREFYHRLTEAACVLRATRFPNAALIAMGHCHMLDGTESRDSERRLIMGGSEALRCHLFPAEIRYVALGHLHRPQVLDGGRIRYSGSPIPLSFSEMDYRHSVTEVKVEGEDTVSVTQIEIPRTVSLLRIPERKAAPIDEVLRLISESSFGLGVEVDRVPFLEVRVLDEGPDPMRRRRIEKALEGKMVRLASIKQESLAKEPRVGLRNDELETVDFRALDPELILKDAYREKYGAEVSGEILEALREVCQGELV